MCQKLTTPLAIRNTEEGDVDVLLLLLTYET